MRARVIDAVVTAFDTDPAFRYFFPDETAFAEHAARFTGRLFDERVSRKTVWVVADGAAVAMWDGPPELSADPIPAPSVATALPPDVTARLERYDAVVEAALPDDPHWYLGVVATHPAYAGRRWGRQLIAAGLERAITDGLPAYLETANPHNVNLYRSVGWDVTATIGVDGLDIWVMRHPGGT